MLSSSGYGVRIVPARSRLTLSESDWFTVVQSTTLDPAQTLSGRDLVLSLPRLQQATASSLGAYDWSWIPVLIDKLRELLRLPRDWDGYGAEPVRPEAALTSALIVNATLAKGARFPEIIPTVDGGVQIEWRRGNRHLEIEVMSPYEISMLYREGGVSKWEGSLLNDPSNLDQLLVRVEHGEK
jgi:hypothetical protein